MERVVVAFIWCWLLAAGRVYWTVSNKPVMYGDNIILTCITGHVLTDRVKCPVRQWYDGHHLLLYNEVSRDVTKYEDRTNMSSTEFSLVIKNYTEQDLNINYTCSCGFKSYTKLLCINDEDFIDGGSTNRYISTTTEVHTTDILSNTWVDALSVVVLVCLLIGGIIIYKGKSNQKRIITMNNKTDDTLIPM